MRIQALTRVAGWIAALIFFYNGIVLPCHLAFKAFDG